MDLNFSHTGKQLLVKLVLFILSILILVTFPGIRSAINNSTEQVFTKIKGESEPDSNIILIHLNTADIEQIGPWPIKRSYYALLINNLSSLKVKKIGLEIFLSAKFVSQAVYDNLLENEISKAGNVVLGSVAGSVYQKGIDFFTDSLSYPTPKLMNENLFTGHLNILQNGDIKIPLNVLSASKEEKSFSYQISGEKLDEKEITINFVSSWKRFENYSLLEFFDLIREQNKQLANFEGKTVLIGISDPQIATSFSSAFDENLPGLALHAFGVDNLKNNRFYKTNLLIITAVLSGLVIIGLIFLCTRKDKIYYLYFFIIYILLSFILNQFFFYKIDFSFFLLPFFLLIVLDSLIAVVEKQYLLKGAISEAEILKSLLSKKEKELQSLQSELQLNSNKNSLLLEQKITELKEDIEKLKENEEDKKPAVYESKTEPQNFNGLVYRSKSIQSVTELIKKIAPSSTTVLVTGESGTGKELIAKAVHALSDRRDKNFIAVNCAALTETLLESELFGHVKGAFTGALADKVGRFEAADKGTIFLDEIGETSENFQVKLLRILQSGEYEKVGSSSPQHADVRVIAATNKNLEKLVREKKFREDLYYRLNVINVHLPPLRERKEDIDVISNYLLHNENENLTLSIAALKALIEYHWNGNVRELESAIKRAVIFAQASNRNLIQLNDFPEDITKSTKLNFEDLVMESLRSKKFSHSSISETAKELGDVNRTLIAENFRGYAFKKFVESEFEINTTIRQIAATDDDDAKSKVSQKFNTWINNLDEDIKKQKTTDFEKLKSAFLSKYKNLPQKFHPYLDEVIKYLLRQHRS